MHLWDLRLRRILLPLRNWCREFRPRIELSHRGRGETKVELSFLTGPLQGGKWGVTLRRQPWTPGLWRKVGHAVRRPRLAGSTSPSKVAGGALAVAHVLVADP